MSATNRLESLPPELLTMVVDYISRPTDLKSLCLTSKVLRYIATPPLYKTAIFDDKTHGWPESSFGHGFLSLSNAGLAHVRTLKVALSRKSRCHKQEHRFFKRALQILPRHKLTAIVAPDLEFDEDMLGLLCTQQSKLTKLSIGPIMFDFNAVLRSNAFGDQLWKNLQELSVPDKLGSLQDLRAYQYLLQYRPSISTLNIHADSCVSGEDFWLDAGVEVAGAATDILFSRADGVSEAARLKLKALTLNDVSSSTVSTRVVSTLDLSILTSLAIEGFPFVDAALRHIALHFTRHGSSLSSFSYDLWDLEDDDSALEPFLRSFGGLKKCMVTGECIDLESLHGHRNTLEYLGLDSAGHNDVISKQKHIVEHFPSLRVLGIDMPDMVLHRDADGSSKIWLDSLLALLTMPQMQAVNIREMPGVPTGLLLNDHNLGQQNTAEHMKLFTAWSNDYLGEIATRAAQTKTRLPVILLQGVCEDWVTDDSGRTHVLLEEPFSLHPVKCIDAFGQVSHELRVGTAADARFMEPELREVLRR